MSERWGSCRSCSGSGCLACGFSGESGDIYDYLNPGLRMRSIRPTKPEDEELLKERRERAMERAIESVERRIK